MALGMTACFVPPQNPSGDSDASIHTHFANEWRTSPTTHFKVCDCGARFGETTHTLDSSTFICSVCDYVHTHAFASVWTKTETQHYKVSTCSHQGLKADVGNHAYNADYKCTVCDYQHIHAFNASNVCEGCNMIKGLNANTWNAELRDNYLRPYWASKTIYNESGSVITETGSFNLMYTPTKVHSVRSYDLQTTYVEGVDYKVEGRKIVRLAGGNLPYRTIDEYYHTQPLDNDASKAIAINDFYIDQEFKAEIAGTTRYIHFYDGELSYQNITSRQVMVTYSHEGTYTSEKPASYEQNLTSLINKINDGQDINAFVYGDSVGTGCNASGTAAGGNVNPYMPHAWDMIKQYIEEKKNVTVNMENIAVGGWKISDCRANWAERTALLTKDSYDLMILRIGGNDQNTDITNSFLPDLQFLLDSFLAENPNGNVIVVSPEHTNRDGIGWLGNIEYIEGMENYFFQSYANADKCALAKVFSFSTHILDTCGKKPRDYLANNINHSNDFMIRAYAQIVLKAIFGDAYENNTL